MVLTLQTFSRLSQVSTKQRQNFWITQQDKEDYLLPWHDQMLALAGALHPLKFMTNGPDDYNAPFLTGSHGA